MKINKAAIKDVIIALAVFPAALLILKIIAHFVWPPMTNEFMAGALSEALFAVVILIITLVLRKTEIYKFDFEVFAENWTCGTYFIVLFGIAINTAIALKYEITEPVGNIILFVIEMLLVGYCEETIFRGLVQRSFHELFGEDSTAAVKLAVFVSSIFFALIHILNAMSVNISIKAALTQTVMTIAIGMCFGAIYFRTGKCLWYVMVLHALNDASAYIVNNRLGGTSATDPISAYEELGLFEIAAPMILYVGLALFLMRNKKVQPLLKEKEGIK